MSKYPNLTVTLTIDQENSTLKAQATCENVSKQDIICAIDRLKELIQSDELETYEESSSFFTDGIFPLNSFKEDALISPIDDKSMLDEWIKEEIAYREKWETAKTEIKDLIDHKYFSFAEDHNTYYSEGIVEIVETDERNSGYSDYKHCRTKENDGMLYMHHTSYIETLEGDSQHEGEVIEYWVWQTTGYMGDDYSGFLLLPLKDGRFWKIGYSC